MDLGFKRARENALQCSFCRKSQASVTTLVSSPGDYSRVYICDECVTVCNSIMTDKKGTALPPQQGRFLTHPAIWTLLVSVEQWLRKEAMTGDAASELAEVRRIGASILAETSSE